MSNLFASPLFEKLLDEDPEDVFEGIPKNFQSFKELEESIKEDVSNLLNTRLPLSKKKTKVDSTPFNYGVNLTAAIFTEDVVKLREVESSIEKALKTFEPRLIDPKVKVQKMDNIPESLFAFIDTSVRVGDCRIPLSFPVAVNTL